MSKDKKEKMGFIEFLSIKADMPSDALHGFLRLEVRGRNTLFLSGCRHIDEYSPERICLRCKDCKVGITGKRLKCASYFEGTVEIEGLIEAVRYEELEGEG